MQATPSFLELQFEYKRGKASHQTGSLETPLPLSPIDSGSTISVNSQFAVPYSQRIHSIPRMYQDPKSSAHSQVCPRTRSWYYWTRQIISALSWSTTFLALAYYVLGYNVRVKRFAERFDSEYYRCLMPNLHNGSDLCPLSLLSVFLVIALMPPAHGMCLVSFSSCCTQPFPDSTNENPKIYSTKSTCLGFPKKAVVSICHSFSDHLHCSHRAPIISLGHALKGHSSRGLRPNESPQSSFTYVLSSQYACTYVSTSIDKIDLDVVACLGNYRHRLNLAIGASDRPS